MSFCIRLSLIFSLLIPLSICHSAIWLGVVVIVGFITIRGFRVRFAFLFLFSVDLKLSFFVQSYAI